MAASTSLFADFEPMPEDKKATHADPWPCLSERKDQAWLARQVRKVSGLMTEKTRFERVKPATET